MTLQGTDRDSDIAGRLDEQRGAVLDWYQVLIYLIGGEVAEIHLSRKDAEELFERVELNPARQTEADCLRVEGFCKNAQNMLLHKSLKLRWDQIAGVELQNQPQHVYALAGTDIPCADDLVNEEDIKA